MNKFVLVVIILSAFYVSTASALDISFTDGYTQDSTSTSDGVVWGGYSLDSKASSINVNADCLCWDWCDDGSDDDSPDNWDTCYCKSAQALNACKQESAWVTDIDNRGDAGIQALGSPNPVGTSVSGDAWTCSHDVREYRDCGDGSYGVYNHNFAPMPGVPYYVIKSKNYDCENGENYDLEGDYTSGRVDMKTNLDCGANLACSESADDVSITSATGSIPNPCKTVNGYSCSVNANCLSQNCVHGICRATNPYCGDNYCDAGENIDDTNECAQDCCDFDFTSDDDSICHAECSLFGLGTFTSGCDNLASGSNICVNTGTVGNCCNAKTYCEAGSQCDGGSCTAVASADLQIIDIIPIQVVTGVDMVKGKSGFVRVVARNNGPQNAVGRVTVTFNGGALTPFNPDDGLNNMPSTGENRTFDFKFKPGVVGDDLAINASISIY
ncbi:MAG: hypothetical protein Q8R47_02190 [Nanoarchaeota archaeon]|nr:hypothetical protein [Nanoarchaeota archaeon]